MRAAEGYSGNEPPVECFAGRSGQPGPALLSYRVFLEKGFQVVAVFDNDPSKVGQNAGTEPRLAIQPMEELEATIAERKIEMAILSVPAAEAQAVADRLAEAGIKGILNFAPTSLTVRDGVAVASVDMAVRLEQLAFRISANQMVRKALRPAP